MVPRIKPTSPRTDRKAQVVSWTIPTRTGDATAEKIRLVGKRAAMNGDAESPKLELDEEDKAFIEELFERIVVPKLKNLHARIGTVSCDFAGQPYGKWNIRFRAAGSGFEILDFEYDEDACGLDLDV
jgi:uncharacterized protein YhdP